jgi:large subunit ribosomal protein L10
LEKVKPMPTAEKAETIEQAKEWYSKSTGVVFTDYRGLKVKELQALRSDLRKKGADFHVLKNTLFRIAAGDDAAKLSDDLHNGTTAFAFVYENETDVTKALLEYARTSKKLVVKGGFFGGKALTSKEVEQLSQLPPRDVLLSQVIGAIAAPLTSLIGTIEALYADPIRVIGAVADKVAEANPIPAPKAEAPVEAVAAEPVATEAAEPVPEAEAAASELAAEAVPEPPTAETPAAEEPAEVAPEAPTETPEPAAEPEVPTE